MAIVKVLARHSPTYKSLINYILNEAKTDRTQVYTQNLRSNTLDGYVQEFVTNEAFRAKSRDDQIFIYHEIISLHRDERAEVITPKVIADLAQTYMRMRGEQGVILAVPHYDKNHLHIHCAVSALNYRTGTSFGLNKTQLRELKTKFQEYHRTKYPELTKSFPEHGKGGRHMPPARWHVLKRQEIAERVRACFEQATSQQDFLNRLLGVDLHYYERNGKATGIEYEGQKFRFSRLLEDRQFADLPVERSEEEQTLQAIRVLRERLQLRDERDHNSENRER